jgi:transglutaminase-like putative cysteine protease
MSPAAARPWLSRAAAILLVLVQCATLAWLEHGYGFAAVASALAILSLVDWFRIEPEQTPHWLWFALLALILLVKNRFAPEVLPDQITFLNTVLAYEMARFLIFVQVVQLYIRRESGRLPMWMAGVACLSMAFASDVRLSPETRLPSMGLCLGFVIAFALYSSTARRRIAGAGGAFRRTLVVAALLLSVLAGGGTASLLRRYDHVLGEWLASHGGPLNRRDVAQGFSGRGRLGDISSWKQHASDTIALRAYSDRRPAYLRGLVFDHYEGYGWSVTVDHQPLIGTMPLRPTPLRAGELVYALRPDETAPPRPLSTIDIWPAADTGSRLFTPLRSAYVACDSLISITENGLAIRGDVHASPYTVFVEEESPPVSLSDLERVRFLQLPEQHVRPLEPYAKQVFGGAETPSEKIAAVEDFFHTNFKYELRSHFPRNEAPVLYFLRNRPAAHCEYFAAAGAVLLRAAGVPSRYVAGYVATERNAAGDYWVARRRDAHAWIEAYDENLGRWVTVECTPPSGVPQEQPASRFSDWLDAQNQRFQEWRLNIARQGVVGLLVGVVRMLFSVPALVVALLTGLAIWSRTRRREAKAPVGKRLGPQFPILAKSLRKVDRLAARRGFVRLPSETLIAFAARLRTGENAANRSLADWYEHYTRVRYGETNVSAAADALAHRTHSLKRSLRTL